MNRKMKSFRSYTREDQTTVEPVKKEDAMRKQRATIERGGGNVLQDWKD